MTRKPLMKFWAFAALLGGLCSPGPALADGVSLSLGFGVQLRPTYSGSDRLEAAPLGFGTLHEVEIGPLDRTDPGPRELREGFIFSGSLRPVPARTDDDDPELAGLDEIDFSIEAGAGVQYGTGDWRVFGDLRYGVIGHESLVAELGGDVILTAGPDTYVTLGPRLLFGSDAYADTYYGVTPGEAARNGVFAPYDPDGGLVSAGVRITAVHQLDSQWSVRGILDVSELVGEAADSPIVIGGQSTQVRAGVTLVRRFNFGR